MLVENSCQNSLTPNSRSVKLLNHMNKSLLKKISQNALIKFIVSRKLMMHMEQAQYD